MAWRLHGPGNAYSTFHLHEFDYLNASREWNHAYLPAMSGLFRAVVLSLAVQPDHLRNVEKAKMSGPQNEILSYVV